VLCRNRGWTILLTKMMTMKKTMMKMMPMAMMMTLEVGLQRRGKASNVWAEGLQHTTRQISSVEEKWYDSISGLSLRINSMYSHWPDNP
jgi:hypothetical protein